MGTHRNQQQQELYKKIERYDELVQEINELAQHLGNETYFPRLRLYREQQEQMSDIQQYFAEVGMPSENTTEEAILSLALKEFHRHLMYIKNEKPED